MSTSATGTVVDENNAGLRGLTIVLHDVSALFDSELARSETDAAGAFSLTYAADATPEFGLRRFRLRIRFGQHVLKEQKQDDVAAAQLSFGTIQLTHAEATGMLATLGSGSPSRVTQGNAISWLCDNVDGWGRLATLLRNAQSNIDVMQLTLDLHKFELSDTAEDPEIVLDFHPAITDPGSLRPVTSGDDRVERLLLDASQRPGVTTRIQIPVPTLDFHAIPVATVALLGSALVGALGVGAIAAGATLPAFLAFPIVGLGILLLLAGLVGIAALAYFVYKIARGGFSGEDDVARWFADAGAGTVHVKAFHSQLYSVTHAKIVIVEGREAVLLGSPFLQGYYDSPRHLIDEPMRGKVQEEAPIHDVSISVRGPAAGHLQEVFNSHWNLADPSDTLPAPPPLPNSLTSADPGEFLTSVQVVRTLNAATFTNAPAGEKGVLEAYLRAIQLAERFIYCENQYFTNDTITDALIDALKAKPDLRVILLLNIVPDIPFYPGWQRDAIKRIADAIGANASQRFSAFTSWSHTGSSGTDHPKPRLAKHYVHAKVAIIDNRWATVGSANLDGASLDYFQVGHALQGGDMRNTETNCVVFEETPPVQSAVDALRRQLWAEHLGFVDANGDPDPTAAELADSPGHDWLATWLARAESKRAGLVSAPDNPSPIKVLRWPVDVRHKTSEDHLKHLQVSADPFDLVKKGPRSFDFTSGQWK